MQKFTDVIYVQGHGALLLFQFKTTVWCFGNRLEKNKGAKFEIRLFSPRGKWFVFIVN